MAMLLSRRPTGMVGARVDEAEAQIAEANGENENNGDCKSE